MDEEVEEDMVGWGRVREELKIGDVYTRRCRSSIWRLRCRVGAAGQQGFVSWIS